ncbi:MAG: TRAP transporter substrate-binding protein DctP [Desulfobacteraceae bacterium]|nr:TRAP transporter substrate-binding protein DctP [Desulfobacteraceae bacterium]MCF8093820.1 TRAP transporter substrate-binding protein DctP [Desulfobacteraceae bacterium]
MKKIMLMATMVMLVCAFVLNGSVQAQQKADIKPVELTIWSAWIPDTFSTDPFMHMFIDKVNEQGKDVNLSIKYLGGPEVFSAFDGSEAVRKGIVDVMYSTTAYHKGAVPAGDALKLSRLTPMEERENGANKVINKFHHKAGLHYLFRLGLQPYFNFYMNVELDEINFDGLKLRSTPIYDPIIKELGGSIVRTEMSEVYTALERGVIDGYGFPTLGTPDHKLEEVTKYVWGPAFYCAPTGIFINLDKWNSLAQEQRDVLTAIAKEMERESTEIYPEYVEKDREMLKEAGVEIYELSPEKEKRLLDIAYEAGWKEVLKNAPAAKELRPLLTK